MRSVAVAACLLVAACGGRPLAPGAPSASPAVVATAEREGARVTLALDRVRLAPGEVVWADVRVENVGPTALHWVGGGCDHPAHVSATVPASGLGVTQPDPALAEWKKRWLLPHTAPAPFIPERAWDEYRRTGAGPLCTADIRVRELAPGAVLTLRAAWDGTVASAGGRADAPNGESTVAASFPITFPPAPPGQFRDLAGKFPVVASVRIALVGRVSVVQAGEALDAALADARFRAFVLDALATERSAGPLAGGLVLDGATWRITVAQKATGRDAEARVDGASATVSAVSIR